MHFWHYNVSIEDAGEFRVVPVESLWLTDPGSCRPSRYSTIVERTCPQVDKDHTIKCKALSNSRPESNGFKMNFIWKRNDTVLANNLIWTVQGERLIIRRLQREDRFDKFTCIAYDSDKLLSNGSNYYQIDPHYGPSAELTLYPSNRTYFVEEGSELANITCSVDCHPHCTLTWDRGLRHDTKLYLGVIDKAKSGIYRCTALNPVTNVNLTTALEVILTNCYGIQPDLLISIFHGMQPDFLISDCYVVQHALPIPAKTVTESAYRNGFPVTMVPAVRSALLAIMSLGFLFCIPQVVPV